MIRYLLLAWLLTLSAFSAQAEDFGASGRYVLGSGDKIHIQVFGEDDLTLEVRIGDSGKINYPFLGALKVTGMTESELEHHIMSGLKGDYLIDPQVRISVTEYRPFYINGEVKKPGGYPFQPGLTFRKAVSLGGGFTERASDDEVFVIRESSGRKEPIAMALDSSVYPGDIITVEQSFF